MNKFLLVSILITSSLSFGAELFNENARIVSTPSTTRSTLPRSIQPQLPDPAQKLFEQVRNYAEEGSVNCDESLENAAQCLLCNCANEAQDSASLESFSKITRVVFSRVKSSQYPNTVCGVVCDKAQFSWTLGTYNEQCERTTRRNPRYFNRPQLRGEKLNKCVQSIKSAAQEELINHPNEIYALNYLNPGASSDRSWLARCRSTQVGPSSGGHIFCNPYLKREAYPTLQNDSIAYRGPYRHDS